MAERIVLIYCIWGRVTRGLYEHLCLRTGLRYRSTDKEGDLYAVFVLLS